MTAVVLHGEAKHDPRIARVSLACPSRLHFGLVEICPSQPSLYGGLGVAVDEPHTRLHCEFDSTSSSSIETIIVCCPVGMQERIDRVLQRSSNAEVVFKDSTMDASLQPTEMRITVEGHPDQHSGMGSGTQLACAVATLMQVAVLRRNGQAVGGVAEAWTMPLDRSSEASGARPIDRLANRSGRGRRSYIGLAAHLYGGLIVDHGLAGPASQRSIERFSAPEAWPVVLITPDTNESITGEKESAYFAQCERPNEYRDRMWSLVRDEILPAVRELDFARFARSLRNYGRYGGEIFAPVQGGIYRDAQIAATVERLDKLGLAAVGQSSWGPTVFAITETLEQAERIVDSLHAAFEHRTSIRITRMTNQPAELAWGRFSP